MPVLPRGIAMPDPLAHDESVPTPLRVDHAVLDFGVVMSSRERLRSLFGPVRGWPRADLSLTQDLVDLGWDQKEFQRRRSFGWATLSPDPHQVLGCGYLDPARQPGFDAGAVHWARSHRIAGGLEDPRV